MSIKNSFYIDERKKDDLKCKIFSIILGLLVISVFVIAGIWRHYYMNESVLVVAKDKSTKGDGVIITYSKDGKLKSTCKMPMSYYYSINVGDSIKLEELY